MKSKHILFIPALIGLVLFYSCIDDPDLPPDMINAKIPEVKTLQTDSIRATSVVVKGEVVKENGMAVTEYGAYWSENEKIDTVLDQRVSKGKGKGEFSVKIENLKPDKEYYVAAYAMNKKGIALGEIKKIITINGLGSISTLDIDSTTVTATTAIVKGAIEGKGDSEIIERGVYFYPKGQPEDKDSLISTMKTDTFSCVITGLKPSIRYELIAYAKNKFGVFTGTSKEFTTTDGKPKVSGLTKVSIDFSSAVFRAEITHEGDSPVIARGFCWKENELPTIEDDTLKSETESSVFTGTIVNLKPSTVYHLRAYATNIYGTSYSNDTVFNTKSESPTVAISEPAILDSGTVVLHGEVMDEGAGSVTKYGFCWSDETNKPDTLGTYKVLGSGKGILKFELGELSGNTTYYVRAFALNDANKIQYSEVKIFKTPQILSYLNPLNHERFQGSTSFFQTNNGGYLLGGDVGPKFTNELWLYDLVRREWKERQAYPEENIAGMTPVYVNNVAYVFGGKNNSTGAFNNNLYEYSPYTNNWIKKEVDQTPSPVAFAAGCKLAQSAYYIGGLRSNAVSGDVVQYNSQDDKWIVKTSLPEAQYGGVALVVNDVIYAGLGFSDNYGAVNNKKLWLSADYGGSWSGCSPIPGEASKIIGGVTFEGAIYVVDNTGQLWKYSPDNDVWSKKMRLIGLNDNVHCIYALEDRIYVGLGSYTGTFISYNPYWDK